MRELKGYGIWEPLKEHLKNEGNINPSKPITMAGVNIMRKVSRTVRPT